MANLISELDKQKESRLKEQDSFLESSKLLLSSNEATERAVLKDIGLDAHIEAAENQKKLSVLNHQYGNEYSEGKVYHYSELRTIGMKYRLFMKRASLYRGKIPADIGAILSRFAKDHNIPNMKHDADRFMVIAPPNMFKDYNSFGEKINMIINDVNEERKTFVKNITDPDPALIYRIDSEHFVLLKQWGADFTLLRRIKGVLSSSRLFINILIGMSIPSFIYLSFAGVVKVYGLCMIYDKTPENKCEWYTIIFTSLAFIAAVLLNIFYCIAVNTIYNKRDVYNPSQFITKNNW